MRRSFHFSWHVLLHVATKRILNSFHFAVCSANQFITEIQIYKYLAMHPCHTDNPLEADVFIVPAQTVSAIWLSREKGPNGEPPVKDEGAAYMREGESIRPGDPESGSCITRLPRSHGMDQIATDRKAI